MSTPRVRDALGLDDRPWPPSPRELLGLPPDEVDARRIESAALARIDRLRPLQLVEPEAVTEAMTLVARAVDELTARPKPVAIPPDSGKKAAAEPSRAGVRPVEVGRPRLRRRKPVPRTIPEPAPAEPIDSRRAVYRVLARTRRLLGAWDAVGEWVAADRPAALDYGHRLLRWRELLRCWDECGRGIESPVIALARTPSPPGLERELAPSQRKKLAAEWRQGRIELRRRLDELRATVTRRPRWRWRQSLGGLWSGWFWLVTAALALALAAR